MERSDVARSGLDKNRKFLRLAQALIPFSSGMGDVLARGVLETLWSTAYERADDYVGDAEDVEIACRWRGPQRLLFDALLQAGGDAAAGFIEQDQLRGGYRIHDLWDHAPPWVKRKAETEAARAKAGRTLADVRRDAGRETQFASPRQTVDHLPYLLPVGDTAKNSPGTGRVGTGRVGTGRDLAPDGAGAVVAHIRDPLFAGVDGTPLSEPPRCGEGRPGPETSDSGVEPTRRKAQRQKRQSTAAPMPFTLAEICTALRETSNGQIAVDPFDATLAKPLTSAARALAEGGGVLADVRLAGEYAAAVIPTWPSGEPMTLAWLARSGNLNGLVTRARAWHARGRRLTPAHGTERVSPTLASADHEAEMRGWFKP